jgi:hypothetical protein
MFRARLAPIDRDRENLSMLGRRRSFSRDELSSRQGQAVCLFGRTSSSSSWRGTRATPLFTSKYPPTESWKSGRASQFEGRCPVQIMAFQRVPPLADFVCRRRQLPGKSSATSAGNTMVIGLQMFSALGCASHLTASTEFLVLAPRLQRFVAS